MTNIFDKKYSAEEINDLERDVQEAFDERFNPAAKEFRDIDPEDLVFRVTITVESDEDQQTGIALPKPLEMRPFQTIDRGSENYKAGFNAALRQVRDGLK